MYDLGVLSHVVKGQKESIFYPSQIACFFHFHISFWTWLAYNNWEFLFFLLHIGTKYDLEFKSPNKSGQNFKSGEDMIQMYKELCSGMLVFLYSFCLIFLLCSFNNSLMPFHTLSFFSGVLEYPIASIEDPFDKEDWEHSKRFCSLGLCQVCFLLT